VKLKGYGRFFKEGFWIVLGQVMMVTGSLVGVRLLTELLSPSSYGELALGMTIATLVNQTILGPLGGGVTRFYAPAIEYGDLSGYLNAARKLVSYAIGLIALIAIFSAVGLTIAGEIKWVTIATIALLFAALGGCNAILSGIQSAARQRAIVALHQGGDPWLRSIVGAGLLLWLGATSTVALIGYAFATILVLGSQAFFFKKIIASNIVNTSGEKNWENEIWGFSWPIGIFGIFTWMQLTSDRWALQIFSTTHEVGNYAVLYQLGFYPISLITGMVMQFLVPILYQRAGDASDSTRVNSVNKLSWYLTWSTLGLSGLIFVVALLFHALIFKILVAEEYNSLSYLLPWMILTGGVFASGQSLASSLLAQMKTREMMVTTIVTALFGVVLNFIGAYWYGINGIVGSGVLFSMLYFICMVVLVKGANRRCFC
jgi:O-antigen/teichoic acid export membrane protein